MKIKTLLSTLILLVFAIIGGGSFDDDDVCWVGGVTVFLIVIAIIVGISDRQKVQEHKAREEEQRKKEKERLEAKIQKYEAQKHAFLMKHGTPDKTIIVERYDINSEILVYENKKNLYLMGKDYGFNDIISCTFSDNSKIIRGKITSVTTSDTGNTIGRSIVGGVVAGSAGAIIGGATSKKHTEFKQDDDTIIHDYTVIININSISEPVIRIHTGDDGRLTNEIVGLMNVIVARK